MQRVLLVDDDAELRARLDAELRQAGFATAAVATGDEALTQARRDPPDLVLLDVELPGAGGLQVLRELKGDPRTRSAAVIALSASREEVERVVAFELGADDVVSKPFSLREVLLRARAVLRYSGLRTEAAGVTEVGEVRIDHVAHQAFAGGTSLRLTPLEHRLLSVLVTRAGRIQAREQLLEDVWGAGRGASDRTLDTHVKQLRRKLGRSGALIETVRNVGYRFRDARVPG